MVITPLAVKRVLVIYNMTSGEVKCDARISVVNQFVGGQDGAVVDQFYIVKYFSNTGLATVINRISIKVKGVAGLNVHPAVSLHAVGCIVQMRGIAIEEGPLMFKNRISDDALHIFTQRFVVCHYIRLHQPYFSGLLRRNHQT